MAITDSSCRRCVSVSFFCCWWPSSPPTWSGIDDLDRLFHKDSLTLHQDGTGEYSGGPAMKSLIRRYGPVRYRKKSPANIYVFNTHEYSGAG
uniref:Transposase n=1 Tax=Steinernema glaseri TaxID=37863 RepID=A0A1I7Z4N0_9BILA